MSEKSSEAYDRGVEDGTKDAHSGGPEQPNDHRDDYEEGSQEQRSYDQSYNENVRDR